MPTCPVGYRCSFRAEHPFRCGCEAVGDELPRGWRASCRARQAGRMPAGVTPRQAAAAPGFPPSARPVAGRSGRVWRDSPAGPIEGGSGGAEYLAEAGRPPLPGGRGMGGRAMRNRAPALGAALLLGITAGLLGLSASASGPAASALAVKPKPSPSPSPAPSGTFVKAYAALAGALRACLRTACR
jgi:hypothetical protein